MICILPLNEYMLEALKTTEEIRQADVIVVLGGGINRGRFLTGTSTQRLVRGAQLYFAGWAPKILFAGGDPFQKGIPEALILAQEAKKLKIPEKDIIMEKSSKDTHGQVREIKKIADKYQWESILLVTSYGHMKRALLAFENQGFKVYPAPADPYEKYASSGLIRLHVFTQILYEYGAIIYYRLRGWI